MLNKNKSKILRDLGIKPSGFIRRINNTLISSLGDKIKIKSIDIKEILQALTMKYDVIRTTVNYRDKSINKNRELSLIVKHLRKNYTATDFSHKQTKIHRKQDNPLEYTKMLFQFIQGSNNGHSGYLVKFYGQENGEIYEEDAGDISLEKLFLEKTPDYNLIKKAVEAIAAEHSTWTTKMMPSVNELYWIKKEGSFREKLHEYLDVILNYHEEKLNSLEENAVNLFFSSLGNYFYENENPEIMKHIGLIHSNLHLGHVYLKYNKGRTLDDILKLSKEDLYKEDPAIKIIDLTGMAIGPQIFDLVDIIKHPVSINAYDYPTQVSQTNLIDDFVEVYRKKKIETDLSEAYEAKIVNGGLEIEKSNKFLSFFLLSNIYRNIRAISKIALLESNKKNHELYKKYLKQNPKYPLYLGWYLADLGQTLSYLKTNKFSEYLKSHFKQNLIDNFYNVLGDHLPGIDGDKVQISKQIINY